MIKLAHLPSTGRNLSLMALLAWLTLACCFAAPFARADSAKPAEPILIAAIFAETGIAAPHNKPVIDMTRFAVNIVNAGGGLLARPLRLVLLDNASTPIGSTLAARKAVEMQATAVIGAHWSSHSLAMAPILDQAHIPMITPASTNPAVTAGHPYVFRACFIDSFQGKAMADFARTSLGARTAAVLSNIDEQYSVTLAQFFKEAFHLKGGEVTYEAGYRGNATDFSGIIKQLQGNEVDIIYLPGYARDSGLFIKQARKAGLKAIFLGGDAWDDIDRYAGSAMVGSYQSAAWHPQVPFKESLALQQRYWEAFGKPLENSTSPLAYDAVMILAEAIRVANSTDRTKIRDALADIQGFQGATGTITLDGQGDPAGKEIIIVHFAQDGKIFKQTITP